MEEVDETIFKVRAKLKGLQTENGFRLFRIYFTDIKVYLIETDSTSNMSNLGRGAPLGFLLTRVLPKDHYDRFDEMDDTREIINSTTWFRTYPYENVVSMWIEEDEELNKLWFDIIQPDHRKRYYGDEDGADLLYFDKELTPEYCITLEKILGKKYHGIKST